MSAKPNLKLRHDSDMLLVRNCKKSKTLVRTLAVNKWLVGQVQGLVGKMVKIAQRHTELATAAIGLSLLIWLRNSDGVARQDSTITSTQLTNTTLAHTSDRDTDRFSLRTNFDYWSALILFLGRSLA